MKGKHYKSQGHSIPIKNSSSYNHIRKSSLSTLECIWPSSIPDSWKHILQKKNLPNIKIHKSTRSTLEFLQETQKYIETIRKPINSNEIEIIPRSNNHSRSGFLRAKLSKISPSPVESGFQQIKQSSMRRRRKFLKKSSLVPLLQVQPERPNITNNPIRVTYRDYI